MQKRWKLHILFLCLLSCDFRRKNLVWGKGPPREVLQGNCEESCHISFALAEPTFLPCWLSCSLCSLAWNSSQNGDGNKDSMAETATRLHPDVITMTVQKPADRDWSTRIASDWDLKVTEGVRWHLALFTAYEVLDGHEIEFARIRTSVIFLLRCQLTLFFLHARASSAS